jgi:small subunit ribosomal protein S16
MAVTIRLTRKGRTKSPFYRVVATDRRMRRDGRFLEVLGTYDPLATEGGVNLKLDKIQAWQAKGATTTPVVRDLIKRAVKEG